MDPLDPGDTGGPVRHRCLQVLGIACAAGLRRERHDATELWQVPPEVRGLNGTGSRIMVVELL